MKNLVKAVENKVAQSDVKVFLTERLIDGQKYGEEICAKSLMEAEGLASKIGATVIGIRMVVTCMICGQIVVDELNADGDEPKVEFVN